MFDALSTDAPARAAGGRSRPADLLAFCAQMRAFLEPCWMVSQLDLIEEIPTRLSEGMCRHTSEFAAPLLSAYTGESWTVRGGEGHYRSEKHGPMIHYWVSNGETIVDLTADQFGDHGHKVVVTTPTNPAYLFNEIKGTPLVGILGFLARTHWWNDAWPTGPLDSPLTEANMLDLEHANSLAFAVVMHQAAGLDIFTHKNLDGPPCYLAGNGNAFYSARGAQFVDRNVCFAPVNTDEVPGLIAQVAPETLLLASAYAGSHDIFIHPIRQHRYSLIEAANADA